MRAKAIIKRSKWVVLIDEMEKLKKELEKEIESYGFEEINKPNMKMPELPQDLTLLDPEGLGAYYTEFSLWSQYATSLVTKLNIERDFWKEALRLEKIRLDDAGLKTNREYEEISLGKLKAEAKLKATEGIYKMLMMGHKSLSREISRRSLDFTRGKK
jgi:hypothetical protein